LPTFNEELKNRSGWKKKEIINFLNKLTKTTSQEEMVKFLDQLKNLGFAAATKSGISISLFDLPKIKEKEAIFQTN